MIWRRLSVIGLLVIGVNSISAQQFNFTQYQNTPLLVNPGRVSTFEDARLYLNYRNQQFEEGDGFHSSILSGIRPLIAKDANRISLGFILMDDRNSQQSNFIQQKVGLAFGMNLSMTRDQQISLGFGADFNHKRFDASGLTTGSQFVEGRGFDPRVANGELFDQLSNNYLGLSLGVVWKKVNANGESISEFELAWRDFNQPNDSFFQEEESPLPSTLQLSGSMRVYENERFSLIPHALFTHFNGGNTFQLGSLMSYRLLNEKKLNFSGGLMIDKGLYAGFQWVDPKYEVGFSYDFPVGDRANAFNRTLEFSLILKKPVSFKERSPKVRTRKKKIPKSNRTPVPKGKTIAKKTTPEPSQGDESPGSEVVPTDTIPTPDSTLVEEEKVMKTSVEVGEITPEGIQLETISQNIEFDFNSTHITDSTHLYLDPLAEMLKAYPATKIHVIGHTDNVGRKEYNLQLSLQRASVVKEYLMERGVDPNQIEVIGKGDEEPIDTNETEEGRSRNRRVEIKIH